MITLDDALKLLPETNDNVVSVLSGGLDSTIMTHLLVTKYGPDRVFALSYDYGQKQRTEIVCAHIQSSKLGIRHRILDLRILGEIVRDVSANISDTSVEMPTIKQVLGDPQPKTYVPFRNMILNSIAFSFAESNKASHIFTGLQVHDEYGYWDTTQRFVDSMNAVADQNRTYKVKMMAPFSHFAKYQELQIAEQLQRKIHYELTMTCYNPQEGISCGKCPSCSERIMNFAKIGMQDPLPYMITIPWEELIRKHRV